MGVVVKEMLSKASFGPLHGEGARVSRVVYKTLPGAYRFLWHYLALWDQFTHHENIRYPSGNANEVSNQGPRIS